MLMIMDIAATVHNVINNGIEKSPQCESNAYKARKKHRSKKKVDV